MGLRPDRFFTDEKLFASVGSVLVFDVESYVNYFVVSFMHYPSGKICFFERHNDTILQIDWIKWILANFCVVGFNSIDYDMIVLSYALSDERISPRDIKNMTNEIIFENTRSRDLEAKYMFNIVKTNHIDLIEVCPLSASLKTYAARLHCKHMQELPYHPDTVLTAEEKNHVREYNFNDLENTALILEELSPHLDLRFALSNEFGKDLRSLSDAQLAQEIINTELHRITGKWPKRPDFKKLVGTSFSYIAPSYIKFASTELKAMLADIQQAEIVIGPTGHVICPKTIEGRKVFIAGKAYTIGMGGLHSVEKCQGVRTGEYRILDRDVTGYYPNLILKNGFYPKHLGPAFIEALQAIVDKRYKAKREGDKVVAHILKIASNGVFGKTSDPYSTLYSPIMTVQTTLTGQLCLLMAIEWLIQRNCGFQVISANTDGIVTLCPQDKHHIFEAVFDAWEQVTGLETEETEYKGLFGRDVNNYLAVKMDGSVKTKGVYSEVGSALNSRLSKNPECLIIADALKGFIAEGVPIEKTVTECQDIKRFISVRKVTGGAQKDGKYLGKTIRWYYAEKILGTITRATNGHNIPLTEGGKPCMILPDCLPSDINYRKYIDDAYVALEDIGFNQKRNQQMTLTLDSLV
jgi:hypothetical protein